MASRIYFLIAILAVLFTSDASYGDELQYVSEDSRDLILPAIQVLVDELEKGAGGPHQDADGEIPEIIPREVLFGTPERVGVLVSPDGKWLSYLTAESGFFNVWIAPVENLPANTAGNPSQLSVSRADLSRTRPVTNETIRGISSYFWASTSRHIIFSRDTFGDENWHIYCVDIETGEKLDLTPYENVSAFVQASSIKCPDTILIGINDRKPEYHDLYRINITTGERSLVQKNDQFAGFLVDDDLDVRFAINVTAKGDVEYLEAAGGAWRPFIKINYADSATTYPLGFDRTGNILYMSDGRGKDTAAIVSWNLLTGESEVLVHDPRSDPGAILVHPSDQTLQAVNFNYYRHNWTVLDNSLRPDLEYLQELSSGDLTAISRTLDDRIWIAGFISDNAPASYYLYDRKARAAQQLFSANSIQERLILSKMHCTTIKSRDGLDLVSYYTLPPWADKDGDGRPDEPLAMVLYVHGGPWERDSWGFDETHQFLANRGYAVLSVNFRGSSGFGKNFTNAGDGEWGRKMQYDLIDAARWSIKNGIADPDRVAIMGSSYGGYATLLALANFSEVFACGVDICGPSNLTSFLLSLPDYWKPSLEIKLKRIGDYRTGEGQRLLYERSPFIWASNIEKPLLIAQGANDPRVSRNESDQIVRALQERNVSVTYALYPDEGHGLVRPGNGLSFYAVAEAFLAEYLGGRKEPIGPALRSSSITIPVGADRVPGLIEALGRKTA